MKKNKYRKENKAAKVPVAASASKHGSCQQQARKKGRKKRLPQEPPKHKEETNCKGGNKPVNQNQTKKKKKKQPKKPKGQQPQNKTNNPFGKIDYEKTTKKKNGSQPDYSHLSHLPIKDQLREIVLSWFVVRSSTTGYHSQRDPALVDRRAQRATNEYWRLTLLGRQYVRKSSGSHARQKKTLRQDATYDKFALCPPLIQTHHAQQRLIERGSNSLARFVPGTRHTLIATFVPNTTGKQSYQRYQRKKLNFYAKKHRGERRRKALQKAKRVQTARKAQERLRTKIRRNQYRKNAAVEKRHVRGGHELLPECIWQQPPDVVTIRFQPKGPPKKLQQQQQYSLTTIMPWPKKKQSEATRKRIHALMDTKLFRGSGKEAAEPIPAIMSDVSSHQPEWLQRISSESDFQLELL